MVPFENQSKVPGIEWIGESFPELLQERLDSPTMFVLPREDRIHAYDHVGIPVELHPSRATIYRIAEDLGVDYVIFGHYTLMAESSTPHRNCLTCIIPGSCLKRRNQARWST